VTSTSGLRSIPTRLGTARWRRPPLHIAALLLVLSLVNAWFVAWTWIEIGVAGFARTDWDILAAGAHSAHPYTETLYRWSPLLLGPVALLVSLPFIVWFGAHLMAALALPSWPMRLLVLVSWPFWQDASNGNVMVFVLLAAAWGIRGNRLAQIAFLALTLLIPRPLMLPVAVWLLWREPSLRVPFAIAAIASLGGAWLMDPSWFGKLASSGQDVANTYNWGPSAIIGLWWVPIGLALAAYLTWKGRLGLASIAISPYWLPYYFLMGLLELAPSRFKKTRSAKPVGHARLEPLRGSINR
jgi:hypothetical protein